MPLGPQQGVVAYGPRNPIMRDVAASRYALGAEKIRAASAERQAEKERALKLLMRREDRDFSKWMLQFKVGAQEKDARLRRALFVAEARNDRSLYREIQENRAKLFEDAARRNMTTALWGYFMAQGQAKQRLDLQSRFFLANRDARREGAAARAKLRAAESGADAALQRWFRMAAAKRMVWGPNEGHSAWPALLGALLPVGGFADTADWTAFERAVKGKRLTPSMVRPRIKGLGPMLGVIRRQIEKLETIRLDPHAVDRFYGPASKMTSRETKDAHMQDLVTRLKEMRNTIMSAVDAEGLSPSERDLIIREGHPETDFKQVIDRARGDSEQLTKTLYEAMRKLAEGGDLPPPPAVFPGGT